MLAWYLVYSKPRQEGVAAENLSRQGYENYLPLIRTRRRRQGQYVTLIEPMFPRYLFIHLSDQTDNWGPIRSTLGVSSLIRFGDIPAQVPDGLIAALRGREDETGVQQFELPDFKPGDRVRIAEGPMAGYEGIFQARSSKERVVVLLDVVGKATRVQMPLSHIEFTAG
jgi:transcriptional antiterminator RfaH